MSIGSFFGGIIRVVNLPFAVADAITMRVINGMAGPLGGDMVDKDARFFSRIGEVVAETVEKELP